LINLDETDLKLLMILSKNGRISGIDLSKKLDISSSTVTRKIKRLEDSGVIKGYLAIIDAEKFGNIARSALTIKLTGGVEISQILDELIPIDDICNIFETMGSYDILLTCCNRDESQIYELIKKIRSMDGILHVDFASIVSRRKILKKVL
jgi:Lrp/AsnC family leucine-responsive transcriptional regulator